MGIDIGTEKIFRVGTNTATKPLGAAIAHAIYDGKEVLIRAVGHGAIGQAGKGIAVAEGHAAKQAIRLRTNFGFFTTTMDDVGEVSGLVMKVVRD
jgi:stage V sporulation protein S